MTVITIGTMRILQMIMDYIASRDLTAAQMAALYDCLQYAIEKFDEELLYCDCECDAEYDADADAKYDEELLYYSNYSNAEYTDAEYKFL